MNEKLFHVGVKGMLKRDDAVLVLEANSQHRGPYWDFPGGRIQQEENLHDALMREVAEEVPSLSNIKVGRLVHAARLPFPVDNAGLTVIFFEISADFTDISLSDEHVGFRWVSKADIPQLIQDSNIRLTVETEQAALEAFFAV